MSAEPPSPPAPSPSGHPLPVEALQDLLGGLLREREALRRRGGPSDLERNRLAIGAVHRSLGLVRAARQG